ncbi:ROK family protein [Calidifontibacter sp. DB0510]|uniref:ROK family protein n=1 Tax=Metallococcus carri TaxID=1656884 RepID=A0A967E9U4_9MICO|nr:ROK family protein [Metallococcus carri]NHN56762.1 ROK family protein [Metallococcus carri]NOP37861.1 ROK family protein [Calidifontibacter sp. DB2511S]
MPNRVDRAAGPARPTTARTAVRQASLREHNLSLVLRAVLESPQPPTRARISADLGLTRATVSGLVDLLIEAQLIEELAPVVVRGAGRPGVPLTATTARAVAIGVEVQVDQITVGITDIGGRSIVDQTVAGNFRHSDPAAVVEVVHNLATPLLDNVRHKGARLLGAGFSVPGLIRRGSGEVRFAPNLHWDSVDLIRMIADRPQWNDLHYCLGNDADVSAVAESWARATARGRPTTSESFIYLSGGVGIGGSMIIQGQLLEGQHGWSGEIGHMCVDPAGPPCTCGARGCLEQFAGRDAIFRAAGLDLTDELPALIAALEAGDPAARTAIDNAASTLGIALANAINLLDVDRVVIGGFLEVLHPYLRRGIERELFTRVVASRWSPLLVEAGQLGGRASVTGAARLVIDQVIADPTGWLSAS